MQFNSPLRYPGGKGKLTDFIKLVFEENGLLDGNYVEPYAGGAAVALTLLLHGYASRIHLNDVDPGVYAFWQAVIHHTDPLCSLIRGKRVSMAEWYRQKAVQMAPSQHSDVELAFATFFLNRTNRSGIIWGGVIGGKKQDGPWKLDARFNKTDLIRRIQKIAMFGSRIRLYNQDASKFIVNELPGISQASLVYLDPPYYIKGGDLYRNFYQHSDHHKIAKLVQSVVRQPWIVSYDCVVPIQKMYSGCPSMKYGISYSAQDRYRGSEIMFFSNQMKIPTVACPTRLRIA